MSTSTNNIETGPNHTDIEVAHPPRRVLVVGSQLDAVGGIARYLNALVDALDGVSRVRVVDLKLEPNAVSHARAFATTMGRLVATRPDLLVLGHVGFGPIGLAWRLLGGRYAVMVYGIDVWGPRTRLIEETLRHATAVWPISSFTEVEVLRARPGARTCEPLGGCIADSFFVDHRPVDGPKRVVTVASLHDLTYKGTDTLVDAVKRLSTKHRVELRVIGSGPGTPDLQRYVRDRHAEDCVTLIGRVDEERLITEYSHADAIVLLSRFRRGPDPQGEGLGLVVLEAAASGVPAVVSCEGGSVDTVIDGRTGFMVPQADVDALTEKLDLLLTDGELAQSMGIAARQFAASRHSMGAFGERVSVALQQACR